ncbi:MAG: Rrf2 family transcriptional regulator [Spirochaetales bacterium]|nr:Rrf2 family transcriptional regulator [Spirochaetales bacterium]
MKISTKSRYGTRAVLEIALNRNKENLTRKQISRNQEIPSAYLENILISLKTNGIIRTIRGPKGGYELAKDPGDITVFQIVDILEGSTDLVPCLENSNVCARNSICVTREVWSKLQKVQEDLLSTITIKDLVEDTKELYSPNFSI